MDSIGYPDFNTATALPLIAMLELLFERGCHEILLRSGGAEPDVLRSPSRHSRINRLQSSVRLSGGYPIGLVGIHRYRNVARRPRLIDDERKLVAIRWLNVVGRRETNPRCIDEEAVVAKMVVCIKNANVDKNPTEQLLTIRLGIDTSGLEKINQLKIACSGFLVLTLREGQCRDEDGTTSLRRAVKSLDEKRRELTLLEVKCSGVGNLNVSFARKGLGD